MSTVKSYCPYDVAPLTASLDGIEFFVPTMFGRLRCLRAGPSTGRVTVFLHGVHDDMDTWGPLLRAAQEHGVDLGALLFVDLPGFGQSENRGSRLELPEVGDAILSIAVAQLGFTSVRLVGHSMGTLVAADLSARHPTTVQSLHLAAGPYYSIVETMNGHWSGGLAGAFATAAFGTQYLLALSGRVGVAAVTWAARQHVLHRLLWPYVAHPGAVPQSVLDHLTTGLRPRAFRQAARNALRYRDGMTWAGVRCPVWAAYGQADRLVPAADSHRLQADLPNAHITTVPDAAHLLHLEQPLSTLRALGLG